MRKGFLPLFLVFFTVLCSAEKKANSSVTEGSITGIVLTEDGKPALDYRVCNQVRFNQAGLDRTQTCCSTKTNHEGRFVIEHLKLGAYEVLASKESEGYSIERQSTQKVFITATKPQATITIRLHNKGAVVLASISDKKTGKIIKDAHLEYSGVDCVAGGSTLRIEEQYYLTIPTDCEVVVIARAKGYRGWVYADPANPSRPTLKLAAGERKVFDLQLEAFPKTSSKR